MSPAISLTKAQIEAMHRLGSATLYEANGQRGAFDCGIKPIHPEFRVAGPAFTIDSAPGDNMMLHHALVQAKPGDVIVMDAKGFCEGGHSGDTTAFTAQTRGLAGFIVDGAVRDSEAVIRLDFPVFARALSIKMVSKAQLGRLNAPVTCGGTLVRPGDVIVGDRDGIVVIAPEELEAVLARGEARERKEASWREQIRTGKTTAGLLGLQPLPPTRSN